MGIGAPAQRGLALAALVVTLLAFGVSAADARTSVRVQTDPGGVVYDHQLYDELVRDGTNPGIALCASALPDAKVRLYRLRGDQFRSVWSTDPGFSPKVNPQITGEDGTYGWEVTEGTYRVRVTKDGYDPAVSRDVIVPPAVLDLHVALDRQDGTPAPEPRDCGQLKDENDGDNTGGGNGDGEVADGDGTSPACLVRPVNARISGRTVRRVVFYLDGHRVKDAARPDASGRFAVTVERTGLTAGRHVLRAKVVFRRRAQRKPKWLALTFERCVAGSPPKALQANASRGCNTRPFLAWVRGDRVRRVAFTVDGRRLRSVEVADWRGRYTATIDPRKLRRGQHVVTARVEFVRRSGMRPRTVKLRFTKCR